MMVQNIFALALGALFGLALSISGATTYDFHAKLFLFEDFRLMEIVVMAIVTALVGIWLMKLVKLKSIDKEPIDFKGKPYRRGMLLGAAIFGIGWGMSASCPGTVPAMIGEGKLTAIFVFIGIFLGVYAFGKTKD